MSDVVCAKNEADLVNQKVLLRKAKKKRKNSRSSLQKTVRESVEGQYAKITLKKLDLKIRPNDFNFYL